MTSPNYRVYVGTYPTASDPQSGGIHLIDANANGELLRVRSVACEAKEAGYLCYSSSKDTLYAVDERKTDGRGPVQPAACVHAFRVDHASGNLNWLNSQLAPGPRPTYLSIGKQEDTLFTANHGDFQHVEHVVKNTNGQWVSQYLYDDSTSIAYQIEENGSLGPIKDLIVLQGHGADPNRSPQAGGHAQASSHAHCAVVDPSGKYLIICNKGTDQVLVYKIGKQLELHTSLQMEEETAPRHIAFTASGNIAYMTCELSSEIVALHFDFNAQQINIIDRMSTVGPDFVGLNEPAEIRIHPGGEFVYVNNRGEDTLVWFHIDEFSNLTRKGEILLEKSLHPGVAARSFTITANGDYLFVADRPANSVRSYKINQHSGFLTIVSEINVSQPAYVEILPC